METLFASISFFWFNLYYVVYAGTLGAAKLSSTTLSILHLQITPMWWREATDFGLEARAIKATAVGSTMVRAPLL